MLLHHWIRVARLAVVKTKAHLPSLLSTQSSQANREGGIKPLVRWDELWVG